MTQTLTHHAAGAEEVAPAQACPLHRQRQVCGPCAVGLGKVHNPFWDIHDVTSGQRGRVAVHLLQHICLVVRRTL